MPTDKIQIITKWSLRLHKLLCQYVTKPKSALGGIFDLTVTLTDDLLTPKFEAFILDAKSINVASLVKFC